MTYPSADNEPYPRHAADLPHRDVGRAGPVPPSWLPPTRRTGPQPDTPRWTVGRPEATPAPHPVTDAAGWDGAPASGGYEKPSPTAAGGYSRPERTWWEIALPDLRNKIVNRLANASWNQAMAAWQRRRSDPLNPHALLFFYAEPPSGTPPRCELRCAGRNFPQGDEPRLALLLHDLAPVLRGHVRARRDLDEAVFNWHEDRSPQAEFVGLGVTSLDTPAGSWAQVQKSAQSDMEIPGRCYAHLFDGSMLLLDRLARDSFGEVQVRATHLVWDASGYRQRHATTVTDLATSVEYGPDNPAIWQWLATVHQAMAGGPNS